MGDTDIVLQGGLWDSTFSAALRYLELDFVENVIISTSTNEIGSLGSFPDHPNIKCVLTAVPENPGPGNINMQIVTAKAGLSLTESPFVVKMRSDQIIAADSMNMMKRFHDKFTATIDDYEYSISPIFALGLLSTYPYCPQDHVSWGAKEDVFDLYDVPLVETPKPAEPSYHIDQLREPIYFGAHYCARFVDEARTHIEDQPTYLIDRAPKRDESMKVWDTLRGKLFKPFPRILMHWIKYKSGYWYHEYEPQGEYYHDEPWE